MRDIHAYETAYRANYHFEKVQVEYRRRLVLEVLAAASPRSVLEVGCGLEPLFDHYHSWDQFCVVEPAPTFAALAAERARGRGSITIVNSTLEEHASAGSRKPYDAIVISSLIHEVAEPDLLLAAASRLSGPTSLIHVNVPNARSFHNVLALEMGLLADLFQKSELALKMQRSSTFDLGGLRDYVESQGFEVTVSGSYFVKPFTHRQMAAMLENGIIDEKVLDGLYGLVRHYPEMGSEIYVNARLRP